uniref:DUF4283 domain-containing protein n=1 Tax=Gossypium raimondii TaxID=29730 RepID=A0A0D2Q1G7_GOSRA|nr:hypothetical protein B456_002G061200 [Gossypium raimondii]
MCFQLIDIETDYYLTKFESFEAYTNFLSRGPWVIFEHYLTVQPWMPQFTHYIHTPTKSIFKLIKIQWDNLLDFSKPLVSKIWIAKRIHKVKYESLPTICY